LPQFLENLVVPSALDNIIIFHKVGMLHNREKATCKLHMIG